MDNGMKLVIAFVAIFISVITLTVITDITNGDTSTITYLNESVNIAPARLAAGAINSTYPFAVANVVTDWRAASDAPSVCKPGNSFSLKNQTGANLSSGNYTLSGSNGYFYLNNTVGLNNSNINTTYVTYTSCPSDYQTNGFGRSVLQMVGGFFALMSLALAIGCFYSIYKDVKN